MQNANASSVLKEHRKRSGLSQMKLAKQIGISQASVSRAEAGREPRRIGPSDARLFSFIQQLLDSAGATGSGEERVLQAFQRVWDHSDEHAIALARIIGATGDLRPIREGDRAVG